uniref:Uncharacterized protein n=1 Tax=Anguilla anguilla TaxID=7936 RepID=A0A0E9UCL0_ANGAN
MQYLCAVVCVVSASIRNSSGKTER